MLARERWGQGFMREAFDALLAHAFGALDLNRLEADIDPRVAEAPSPPFALAVGCSREPSRVRETRCPNGLWRCGHSAPAATPGQRKN